MKLFLNTTSPYARLVQILLLETGLDAQTKLVMVDPWNAAAELLEANPAAKIPALSLDDGTHLVESACIADYLIARSGMASLWPLSYPDASRRLGILGLARAAMDCAFGVVIQERFGAASVLGERWLASLPRIAARLEALLGQTSGAEQIDLADLTLAVAFSYIDFRLPAIAWRAGSPLLAARLDRLDQRASLIATRPA